jgi:hypothetical protein
MTLPNQDAVALLAALVCMLQLLSRHYLTLLGVPSGLQKIRAKGRAARRWFACGPAYTHCVLFKRGFSKHTRGSSPLLFAVLLRPITFYPHVPDFPYPSAVEISRAGSLQDLEAMAHFHCIPREIAPIRKETARPVRSGRPDW